MIEKHYYVRLCVANYEILTAASHRVGTCYCERLARLVVDALNQSARANEQLALRLTDVYNLWHEPPWISAAECESRMIELHIQSGATPLEARDRAKDRMFRDVRPTAESE